MHTFHFKDENPQNPVASDDKDIWFTFRERISIDEFVLHANQELIVTLEMDWKTNAAKDFSLVVWGTSR